MLVSVHFVTKIWRFVTNGILNYKSTKICY